MRLQVARIGKPHGIRGEVTVQLMTDDPDARFEPGTVFDVESSPVKKLTVEGARWNKEILLVAFDEVPDRNNAETMRGSLLFLETAELEEDDDDAWYEHELVGLSARIGTEIVGKVTGLRTNDAQDLLIIEDTEGAEVLVPFVEAIVPEVDLQAGHIRLTPPEGLFTLNRAQGAEDGQA
ncbi:ribosome maturation factor RimM [Arthrobacter sp. AOP36-C1-22]|uniref:ribosome maturation factor RimM n=1 Tax=Arthrobacter sp. AOP36-C1-22 TaxID=3457683 RepID=UPI004033BA6A